MGNYVLKAALVGAALLTLSAQVTAATVDGSQGGVVLNQGGKGYKTITGQVTVNPGDMLMVHPGKVAMIVYSDSCIVPVEPGKVVSVQLVPACASAAVPAGAVAGSTVTVTSALGTSILPIVAGAGGALFVATQAGLIDLETFFNTNPKAIPNGASPE